MRFRRMVKSNADMEADAEMCTSMRRVAVCGTSPRINGHRPPSSSAESMSYSSSQDSDDVDERAPESEATAEELAELAERRLLVAWRRQREQLAAFESSYKESKTTIRKMAQELVMKIREHEVRLLEEVETRRDTAYKRLGVRRDAVDRRIDALQQLCSDVRREEPAAVEKLQRELSTNSGDVAAVESISISAVRCNTAFATLDCPYDFAAPYNGTRRCSVNVPAPSPTKPTRLRTGSLQVGSSLGVHHLDVASAAGGGGSEAAGRRFSLQVRPHYIHLSPMLQRNVIANENQPEYPQAVTLPLPPPSLKLLWEVTTEGSEPGQLNCPNDVLFLPTGELVISDRDNHRLQVLDSTTGAPLRCLGNGRISPRRIALTRDNLIAVTDSKDNLVKLFNASGQQVAVWGRKRFKPMFKAPCAIACTSHRQFIVSDMERHSVTLHATDSKLLRHLGRDSCNNGDRGGGTMEFHSPSYVTVNHRDQIIVSDNWNHSVTAFDQHGTFVFAVEPRDTLKYPNGVTSDRHGNLYVASWGSHSVLRFGPDGKFDRELLNRSRNGIYHPAGVAVLGDKMAVTEYSDTHSALRLYILP